MIIKIKDCLYKIKKIIIIIFKKKLIYQPELSEILFYKPGTKKYTVLICKVILNKIIRKELVKKTFNYIGEDYYRDFVLTGDDTLILGVTLQFASNFSNIKYSGYMYNIREKSNTHGKKENMFKKLFDYNYFLFNKKFFSLIKDFNKDRNFFFYYFKITNELSQEPIKLNKSMEVEINDFYKSIYAYNNISNNFRDYLKKYIK